MLIYVRWQEGFNDTMWELFEHQQIPTSSALLYITFCTTKQQYTGQHPSSITQLYPFLADGGVLEPFPAVLGKRRGHLGPHLRHQPFTHT